jgi:Zn-dependent protease with chaperone function
MDFYTAQDHARRQSRRLVLLFLCAVAALIALTNLVILFALWLFNEQLLANWMHIVTAPSLDGASPAPHGPLAYVDWRLFGAVSVVVCGVVAAASLWKTAQLSRGGKVVATMLGGELLSPASSDRAERRLLNVVEEMALAASLAVPPVYVLPEPAINAFAAGFSTDDAVIGITRGALQQLDRDEMQGVVGHELSHILNGDMRLNMRLLALLHGILFIATTGRVLLEMAPRRTGRSSGSHRGAGGSLALIGLALLILGSGGVLFGRMIKAGISRQREFLADASSVQFTRNPHGLANALKRIGGIAAKGRIGSAQAEAASHLFFANGLGVRFSALFATHPPLEQRIRRIEPGWSGRLLAPRREAIVDAPVMGFAAGDAVAGEPAPDAMRGESTAVAVPGEIPATLRDACHDAGTARDVILRCLRHVQPGVPGVPGNRVPLLAANALDAACKGIQRAALFPLVELAMPALKTLPPAEQQRFRADVDAIAEADCRLDFDELVIISLLMRHLWQDNARTAAHTPRFGQLQQVESALSLMLSAFAWACHDDETHALSALNNAARLLQLGGVRLLPREGYGWRVLDSAMARLSGLYPLQKPRVLKACRAMVEATGRDASARHVLIQSIAAALDCPFDPAPVIAVSSSATRVAN